MKYAEAHSIVTDYVQSWRRKHHPYEQAETVVCPACGGNLLLTQAAYQNAQNIVSARCSSAFCVNYTE